MRINLKEQFLKQKEIIQTTYDICIPINNTTSPSFSSVRFKKTPKMFCYRTGEFGPGPTYIKSTINCFSSKFMSIVNLNYFRERLLWQITLFCVTQWVWKYVGRFLNVGLTFKLVYRPCATLKKNLDLLGIEKKLNASFGVNTINCMY